jgi:hypothetical protein
MTKYEKYKLIIASCFCSLFLLILFSYSLNGRYILREESLVILDTKTGTLYIPQGKKYLEINDFTEMNNNNENE